ncbi:MAG TPA: c-type cytochrome [Puia sp.]|nr:c-type cytochrome [Puia sp.]
MSLSRKFIVITGLSAMVVVAVAGTKPGGPPEAKYKNLKVLPKNISSKKLSEIMVDEFQDDLGVSCNFCHAENKDTHKPDYASDEKPEKQIARAMMRMTIRTNRKYFNLKHPMIGDSSLVITCNTCHHGNPHPESTDSQ